jgi:hypothetical protein
MVPVRWSVMSCSTQMLSFGGMLLIAGCGASTEVINETDRALSAAFAPGDGVPQAQGTPGFIDPNAPSVLRNLLKLRSPHCPQAVAPVAPAAFEPFKIGAVTWVIHERGVGDILTGAGVPESVLTLEGETYKALYFDPMEGKDEMAMMMSGLMDQDGYRTIRLTQLDLTLRMTLKDRILDLDPGFKIRTPQGTGVGSTLGELISAHGDYSLSPIPEPYECAVLFKSVKGVAFQFKNCEAACANEPVVNVYVYGQFEPPDDELH